MLLPHNINVYNELEQTLSDQQCCCVVMGTGCGKTYVASEYLDNHNFKALVVAPRRSICDSWEKHTGKVDTITYQKLAKIYKNIDFSNYDIVICDEVHHIGAPTWGEPIKYLIDNKIVKVIGLTESSIRYSDGGKDVAEDFFEGNIAFGENVSSAIEKNILNPVTYVGAMYNSDGLKKTLRGKIQSRLYAKLNLTINKTPTISEILKKNMLPGKRKGIIFASTIEDINSAVEFVKSVYPKTEIKFVHSKQPESYNEAVFKWFENTDEGYICSVDMISEGVHIKGVNTIIMLRRTESVNLFNQQLGRCLDAKSKEPAILFDLVNNKYSIRIINNRLRIRTNSIFDSGKLNICPSEQLIIKDYTKDIVEVLKEIKLNLEGRWTEEEDNLLRKFYEEHPGGKGLKKFVKQFFPHRSYSSVKKRNYDLGLTTTNNIPYSEEEIEIIRKYYPIEGKFCYLRLNGRSFKSVGSVATKLGIKADALFWSDEEKEIVRKYYPTEGGPGVAKRLPNKTPLAIKAFANKYKIRSLKYNEWTQEDDDILKKHFETTQTKQLVKLLSNKHTVYAIKCRAKKLGIRKITKKIMCIETGQVFDTARDAARFVGQTSKSACSHIGRNCRGEKTSAYGYHWRYCDE